MVVGYNRYLDQVKDLTEGKELISSGMTKETERCKKALTHAAEGKTVSLISSGDPGIYGMAGLALELANADGLKIPIEIVPGVSASNAAASRLGAPLMLDFAAISLSDLLVPWEMIKERVEAVAKADMAIALYNPRSKKRVKQLEETTAIILKYRDKATPVGVCTSVRNDDETIVLTDLSRLLGEEINMKSIVIIGNSSSIRFGDWFVTPRGYKI